MSERFDTFAPPPSGIDLDRWQTAEPASEGEALDPHEAAALLARTASEAERGFELRPPWLTFVAGGVVLVAYGAVWLSVRHQHPYIGPPGWALAVVYGTIAAWVVLVTVVSGRATRGVGGRASRQRRLEGMTFATIWICVYVVEGALAHAGVSKGVAYGIWPAAAPLVVVGSAVAAYNVSRARPGRTGFALAAVALGSFASFAGPTAVWGVIAVGFCGLVLVGALAQLRQRRA